MPRFQTNVFVYALIALPVLGWHSYPSAQEKAVPFEAALKQARVPTIADPNVGEPVQADTGRIDAYMKMIKDFAKHPRINEVKLELFYVVQQDTGAGYQEVAAKAIGDVLNDADLSRPEGREIAFTFVDFHARFPSGPDTAGFQDLPKAERIARELLSMAEKEKSLLMELEARHRLGEVLIRRKMVVEGVQGLLDAARKAEAVPDEIVKQLKDYKQNTGEFEPDPSDRYRQTLFNMESAAGTALEESHDPRVAKLVQDYLKNRSYIGRFVPPLLKSLENHEQWVKANFAKRHVENPNFEPVAAAPGVEAEESTRGRGWLIAISTLMASVLVFLGIRLSLGQRNHAP